MIIIVWPGTKLAIRTVGEFDEVEHLLGPKSEWYPDKYPHPDPEVKELGSFQNAIDARAMPELDLHDVTPQEAFAALSGLGLPNERDCGTTAVERVFESQGVKKVHMRQVNRANRTIIDSIEFDDGTRMFLASSPVGAVVYRISKPRRCLEAANG